MENKQNHAGGCLGFLTIIWNLVFIWALFYVLYKFLTGSNVGAKVLMWVLLIFFVINMYFKYR